jgi:importin subunit beta-1
MSSLEDILVLAQSPIQEIRLNTSNYLTQQLHSDPGYFLLSLSKNLANPASQLISRQVAGFYIKNTVMNSTCDPTLVNLWEFLSPDVKSNIKTIVLSVLADETKEIRQVDAQIISAIAKLELGRNQWPELLPILIANGTNINPIYKETALMALGYICEQLQEFTLNKEQADEILTVIVAGLSIEEKSVSVTKTSLNALRNSLKFINPNIQKDVERKIILNVLYKLCQHPSSDIRRESLVVICDIAYLYYDFIENDLIDLGNVTYSTINNDEISVSIIAIEFWNIIADIEVDRMGTNTIKNYISTAANSLVPILLQKVHIFDETEDESEWSLHKSCGATFANVSVIIKDSVVPLVYNFITNNISSTDWKLKRSAVLVFGSIMEGPSVLSLSHLVRSSISLLINLCKDENELVRQTSAWCLSRISQHYTEILQTSVYKDLIAITKSVIYDKPNIAQHGFYIVHNLTLYEDFSEKVSQDDIDVLYHSILQISFGSESQNFKIRAFSALISIMEKAPAVCMPMIENKIEFFIDMLQQGDYNMQVIMCSLLQTVFSKVTQGAITEQIADKFISVVIQIMKSRESVLEEAIEAIGRLAENLYNKFEKYLSSLIPILIWGIDETASSSICRVSVICVGDLARSLGLKFGPYVMHFIPKFLKILSSDTVDLNIKIECIGTLGDLSCVPGFYMKYMTDCLTYIDSAANLCVTHVVESENPDLFEGINSLREVVIMFYSSLICGLSEAGIISQLIRHIGKLIEFCLVITQDYLKSNSNVHFNAIGLLGDIATNFGESAKYLIKTPSVLQYLNNSKQSPEKNIRDAAFFAYSQISCL